MPPRLSCWNDTSNGAYFITVCTAHRRPLLGRLEGDTITPTALGDLVIDEIEAMPAANGDVGLDAWALMPDHLHAIVLLTGTAGRNVSLTYLVAALKAGVTREARKRSFHPIDKPIWQGGFYDRVIRNDAELNAARAYISTNPLRLATRRRELTGG